MPSWKDNDLRGRNWKALAGSAANRAKEYVVQKEYKNTYENVKAQLKGESSGSSRSTAAGAPSTVEQVHLFPGWAVRRYRPGVDAHLNDTPFDLEVFVAGYATATRPRELATRSQRVFMQLAKRFASLPKLPTEDSTPVPRLSRSTEDLLKLHPLPATPAEMAASEEREMAALEAQLRRAELDTDIDSASSISVPSPPSPPGVSQSLPATPEPENIAETVAYYATLPIEELKKLHANLNSRLEPFWSAILTNRRVRVSVYASLPDAGKSKTENLLIDFGQENEQRNEAPVPQEPLATREAAINPSGEFQQKIRIPWDTLATHPQALFMAFGDRTPSSVYKIFVRVELLSPSSSPFAQNYGPEEDLVNTIAAVTLNQTRLRIISDIDDTIKVSNILGGAKLVFHNVFVSELSRLVIKDMSAWYNRMWTRGVRFHYVSNSPFELLPVINEFIQISELPEGSVKLRSYSGRSLFNGLVSSPSVRKRNGVVDVLNNFPESQFILVGDSGEQDLELYTSLASERSNQVIGVFIRDVSTMAGEPLTDPTGARWQEGMSDDILRLLTNPNAANSTIQRAPIPVSYTARPPSRRTSSMNSNLSLNSRHGVGEVANPTPVINEEPGPISRPSIDTYGSNHSTSRTSAQEESNLNSQLQGLPLPTRRRIELQIRVNRARDEIPSHIKLRIFRDPLECTETEELLYSLGL